MAGEVDVVIVGAGISGLSAAKLLTEEYGVTVKVLEARNRVGGRTYTVQDEQHGTVDLGAGYVGPTQNRVYRLAKALDLKFYDVNEKERSVLSLKGTWKGFRGSTPPFWNPFRLLDLNHIVRTVEAMAKQVPVQSPWLAAKAHLWDSMTVKEFIDKTAWMSSTRALMTLAVQSLMTVEPHEVSLLAFLWYINSGQGLMRMICITNGAQEKKIVGGAQQLSEGLARKLPAGCVQLSSAVVMISQEEVKVTVTTDMGSVHTGKYVILAIPPAVMNKIRFQPALPSLKNQLLQRVPMGSVIKTVMFYKTAFWRDLDLNGTCMSEDGPVGCSMDDTKPDGSSPAIMGFILADKSRQLCQLAEKERQQALCQHYATIFRCDKFLKPIGYLEKDWMSEEYSGGCFVSSLPPGVLTSYGRVLREPLGNVHFASTETATYYAGYMEGAIQAGERAAREVLCSMGRIEQAEIWQEEPESLDHPAADLELTLVEKMLPSVGSVLVFLASGASVALAYVTHRYLTVPDNV
ncbi:LOW QUALITY PROTEIN: amine oxidase [flavin-containing]-like [Liolophura sinensis]|uniref:LOW QUALITY PROTEIN: amine oxidase [flavin-containing]-like n=1 Tax=Liolophura sinensis TaxID=3198878 RepID=UPI0031591844